MEIKTALILCAGYGKRLNPITLNKPKPLIEINKTSLLQNTLNLINSLGIKNILINSFYLSEQIEKYVHNLNLNLKVIKDGDKILDTGGGIYNMMKSSLKSEKHFLVFNPDTVWDQNYIKTINDMIKFYFLNPNRNTLLVVDKKLSFDQNLKGDFKFNKNLLTKQSENDYIFTGCQIINRGIINEGDWDRPAYNFSISNIWNSSIESGDLFGFESKNNFKHVTNLEIYQKLLENN